MTGWTKGLSAVFLLGLMVLGGCDPSDEEVENLKIPAQVILIRHGEKPAQGNELNDRGRERARALVNFFQANPAVTKYGTPVAIYAMKPGSADGSIRAIQTVTPLAAKLGLTVHSDYTKDEIQDLVSEILSNPDYEGKMVLICWEHKVIPSIVQEFGYDDGPEKWPGGDVYDRVWILNFSNGKPASFQDLPEHLLPGDSDR